MPNPSHLAGSVRRQEAGSRRSTLENRDSVLVIPWAGSIITRRKTHVMIPPDLHEFLEAGVSVLVGTRSDRLLPEAARGLAARVEAGGAELTVFLPKATSDQTIEYLRHNGRIAVCVSRPCDHRSVQLKGSVISIREADESDRQHILQYRIALAETWGTIGIPPRITLRMSHWPCHAVRLRAESIFNQTPGPGAGNSLATPDTGGVGR